MEKWALITGASSGIGEAFCYKLEKLGYNLIMCARNLQKLDKIASKLKKVKCLTISVDLTQDNCNFQIKDFCKAKGVFVNLLINNAGFGNYGDFFEEDDKIVKDMIKVNCIALASITNIFLKDMLKNKDQLCQIIQISSLAGFFPGPHMANYYATKAYVNYLTQALSYEIKDSNVSIIAVCPGPVKTNFQKSAGAKGDISKLNIPDAFDIADFALKNINKNKVLCVPGFKFKFFIFITRFLSKNFLLKKSSDMLLKKAKDYQVKI